MVEIKTPEQIASMRAAGLVVAEMHRRCAEAAVPGTTTAELDRIAAAVIAEHGAKPNFLGYGGFPGNICTSVNDVVVHGIPSEDTVLASGDIISIDAGAIIDGWHADAALTVFVGDGHPPEVHELSRVTEHSLWAGIAAMRVGGRLVDISRAVERDIRKQPPPPSGRWGIVEEYGGHGIGSAMHMEPHVLNYVERRRGKGPRLVAGMCLAIEPMVTLGDPATHVLSDDWTVKSEDGGWSAHWEHSIALTERGPLVLTAPDGGRARLAELGVEAAPDPLG
ncbi:type I methionyl aminopeptidase [Streptomyces sp. ST2-7A]|uniref:type I methionyl aminopeptidase n=1 Tax=Streptomyces sp. ST2-7A TaxID=2907214 RepID=UPI001F33A405|nr:type I methionyl aminopeptidase [Streptomyces sp. ST2-7A]MCE7078781.1 type I methionyl aminopeptidase [Streptomyces sp. ST2-7A]